MNLFPASHDSGAGLFSSATSAQFKYVRFVGSSSFSHLLPNGSAPAMGRLASRVADNSARGVRLDQPIDPDASRALPGFSTRSDRLSPPARTHSSTLNIFLQNHLPASRAH